MDLITLDFETYYDDIYSLKKLTTEAYIRDPRFEVIGVSIKVNNEKAIWYSGDEVSEFFSNTDFSNKIVLAHNTIFDGAVLSWVYKVKPKLWLDTLSMAKPYHANNIGCSLRALAEHYKIGAKGYEVIEANGKHRLDFTPEELQNYANYCIQDTELTHKLFKILRKLLPVLELQVIHQVINMFVNPIINLDTRLLEQYKLELSDEKDRVIERVAGKSVNKDSVKSLLRSNNRFAKLLGKLGIEVPLKTSPTTGKETYALAKTDAGFQQLLSNTDDRVANLAKARLTIKSSIAETRTNNLIEVSRRGKLPVKLNYYGAHTGRFSGGEKLNLQNLPRGGTLRESLVAPENHVFVTCDSAQIEARLVAYVAGQADLVRAFSEGRDVYSEFASDIFGSKVTKEHIVKRYVGKTCILGLGYGMGAKRLKDTLAIGQQGVSINMPIEEVTRIVRLYRNKNYKIKSLWDSCNRALSSMVSGLSGTIKFIPYRSEKVELPNGMNLIYPCLRRSTNSTNNMPTYGYIASSNIYRQYMDVELKDKENVNFTNIYGAKLVENIIQALARIVIVEQMVAIGKRYNVVFQVHDEIVVIVPKEEASRAREFVELCMSTAPVWAKGLPISCESGVGINYKDAK